MLFPGDADEDDKTGLLCQVEQPPRRDTVCPDRVDPVGAHRREVGRNRRRRWIFAAVIIRAECPVRDTPERLARPRRRNFPCACAFSTVVPRVGLVSRGRCAKDPSRHLTSPRQGCTSGLARRDGRSGERAPSGRALPSRPVLAPAGAAFALRGLASRLPRRLRKGVARSSFHHRPPSRCAAGS